MSFALEKWSNSKFPLISILSKRVERGFIITEGRKFKACIRKHFSLVDVQFQLCIIINLRLNYYLYLDANCVSVRRGHLQASTASIGKLVFHGFGLPDR